MRSSLHVSSHKLSWLAALGLSVVSAFLLLDVEARYIDFIESLDDITVEVRWVDTRDEQQPQEGSEKVTLSFEVLFHNASEDVLWVEAINTQLFLNGQYLGAYSIVEGRHEVPAGATQAIPLTAVLWETRRQLLQEARGRGEGTVQLHLIGRARTRLDVGGTELKVFYPVRAAFPLR
jgi:hypothetical protein